jgi:hypothetical protein
MIKDDSENSNINENSGMILNKLIEELIESDMLKNIPKRKGAKKQPASNVKRKSTRNKQKLSRRRNRK